MKIEQFRSARAEDLKVTAGVLEKVFSASVNTTPIYLAANSAMSTSPTLKDGTTNPNLWGYEIEDFKIPVDTVKHVRPKGVDLKKIELTLNMRLIADFTKWETMEDPFIDLNFNAAIRGISDKGPQSFNFHIDKHDMSKESEEPHPVYHLQYASNPDDDDEFEYGSTLSIDTPRVMHHPVDFVLGIGLLTVNFFPLAFDELFNVGYFPSLYSKYQEMILKPYFHTLANYWEFNKADIVWSPTRDLCPFLCP